MQSSKERENKKLNEEIMELLSAPTTKVCKSITLSLFLNCTHL